MSEYKSFQKKKQKFFVVCVIFEDISHHIAYK